MIATLFARKDSIYKSFLDCDVWDIDRNAKSWPGGCPVVAHPPCRAWGRLRQFAHPEPDEKDLAFWALEQARKWGGVLEHPSYSTFWQVADLPKPQKGKDIYGGWTMSVLQQWWGHRAEKRTWLYICGVEPSNLPPIPYTLAYATHTLSGSKKKDKRPEITKAEREHTPVEFAKWLVNVASRVRDHNH